MYTDVSQKDLKQLYNQLKSSAKKRNIKFDLNVTDLYDLSFPIKCPILDMPIYFNRGKAQDNSISIDRIDSKRGYESDNLVVVSNRANTLKRDATLLEMQKLVEFYSTV